MEEPTKSPIEQLKEISDERNASWDRVIENMKAATFEYILDISDEEKLMLEENFWSAHVALLERAELLEPGIATKIMTRAELIGDKRREFEIKQRELDTAPQGIRRGFLKSVFGVTFRRTNKS